MNRILRILKNALFIALLLYGGGVFFLYTQQRTFIYKPDTAKPVITQEVKENAQNITVTTKDGLSLHGWFFPPKGPIYQTILFFHGNSGNIQNRLHKTAPYIKAGYGVLMAEYRGYGGNAGTPDEGGLALDARAYYDWLLAHHTAPKDLILYGESLGSGVAVQLATEVLPRALILEVPFATLSDPAARKYPFIPFIENLMHDKFRSIDKIAAISAPKLFLIAAKDEVVGAQTGLNLYEKAQEPKTLKIFDDGAHNTLYKYKAQDTVLAFLSALK